MDRLHWPGRSLHLATFWLQLEWLGGDVGQVDCSPGIACIMLIQV